MPDAILVLMTVIFFTAAVLLVRLCDSVIGPDSDHGDITAIGMPDPEPELAR